MNALKRIALRLKRSFICRECGRKSHPPSNYCTYCGTKLVEGDGLVYPYTDSRTGKRVK